jgi:hypothetical protein
MSEKELSEREIAERRDAALKRAMSMPPKPHKSPSGKPKKAVKRPGQAKRK